MDMEALKKLNLDDLKTVLAENRDELRKMRFKDSQKQLKDIRKIRTAKKTIARISTMLTQNNNNKQ